MIVVTRGEFRLFQDGNISAGDNVLSKHGRALKGWETEIGWG